MATRELLSPAQRRRLTEPPDPMDEWLLARHYTLSAADLARDKSTIPRVMKEFTSKVYHLMPRIHLTDLLVEVDSWTGFTQQFIHLKSGEPPKDLEPILAAVLADGTNLGLAKMADASAESEDGRRMTFRRLAWADDWHLCEENYHKALSEVVDVHHALPFSSYWGEGRSSSSDGQRYRSGGHKDFTSQVNARYGRDPGLTIYTHVSNQYAPFYTKVINTGVRDATHVLDGLLHHESDLQIEEHFTDSEGFTDQCLPAVTGSASASPRASGTLPTRSSTSWTNRPNTRSSPR